MSGRKPTPDVLGNVLGKAGRSSRKPDAEAEAVKRHDAMTPNINEKPFKLTAYIHPDLNDEADVAVVTLKKSVGRLTKSMLVEEALRICLADPAGSGFEAALRERNRR